LSLSAQPICTLHLICGTLLRDDCVSHLARWRKENLRSRQLSPCLQPAERLKQIIIIILMLL
ncbi:hypothetical protein, partial [Microcoleus sp.]|uniref:hypothetical protein n=1 Tax=Microcoleus sp. TaxID=44472 RepID=UPI00403E9924